MSSVTSTPPNTDEEAQILQEVPEAPQASSAQDMAIAAKAQAILRYFRDCKCDCGCLHSQCTQSGVVGLSFQCACVCSAVLLVVVLNQLANLLIDSVKQA